MIITGMTGESSILMGKSELVSAGDEFFFAVSVHQAVRSSPSVVVVKY